LRAFFSFSRHSRAYSALIGHRWGADKILDLKSTAQFSTQTPQCMIVKDNITEIERKMPEFKKEGLILFFTS
jgi:hypothetical protein